MLLKHPVCGLALAILVSVEAGAQPARTKLIDNGPDADRLVIVILGDGYAATDQQTFVTDTEKLVLKGLLTISPYAQHTSAFNVYRVDLVSKDSGISAPGAAKDTALQTSYVGGSCYIKESNETVTLLEQAIREAKIPRPYKALILLNDQKYGGCALQNERFYVTRIVGPRTVAHEYGHVIARLYDEYPDQGHNRVFSGTLNELNCSSVTDRQTLTWTGYVAPGTALPTANGTAALGMFEGCNSYSKGLYKPTVSCLMLDPKQPGFCPVCKDLLVKQLVAHQSSSLPAGGGTFVLARAAQPPVRGAQPPARGTQPPVRGAQPAQPARYVDLLVRVFQNGTLQVLDASEETGTAPISAPATSDWFYEVKSNNVSVAVAGLPASAFEQRGYGGSDAAAVHTTTATSATMHLSVPGTALNQLRDRKLELNVYRTNQRVDATQFLEVSRPAQVTPDGLQQLLQKRAVTMMPAVPAGALGNAIITFENTR